MELFADKEDAQSARATVAGNGAAGIGFVNVVEMTVFCNSGLDSSIAEKGGGLSEGQAQRIAIARSILRPGSILILDEVTSALDETTEQELLRRLTQSQIGKTLIFVTHRPAVMQYCNQVLKITKPAKKQ